MSYAVSQSIVLGATVFSWSFFVLFYFFFYHTYSLGEKLEKTDAVLEIVKV